MRWANRVASPICCAWRKTANLPNGLDHRVVQNRLHSLTDVQRQIGPRNTDAGCNSHPIMMPELYDVLIQHGVPRKLFDSGSRAPPENLQWWVYSQGNEGGRGGCPG